MNYKNPEKIKNFLKKAQKSLIVFFVSSFALAIIFLSLKTFSDSLPDCSTISGTAQPGTNCLFFGLPLCSSVASPNHRVNCADLIDLPLCSDLKDQTTISSGKNCVLQCSDSAFDNADTSLIRGQDYAIHNNNCLRFCDDTSEVTYYGSNTPLTLISGTNCVARKCNQLPTATLPQAGSNCNLVACNLLTADELNQTRIIDDSSNQYCDGSSVKCYDFVQSQLPYVRVRAENSMCQIHNCSSTCGTDEIANITAKGDSYADDYKKYITAESGFNIVCNPVSCKPTFYRQYRCSPQADNNPTTPNSSCDSSGSGATCFEGYCYKTIDCNLTANASESECLTNSISDNGTVGSAEDTMNSWFYRPKPMNKAVVGSSGILREMQSDICYSMDQMKSYGWGKDLKQDVGLFTIELGYFHSEVSPDEPRSPGMCSVSKSGSRGSGYIFLCGNRGQLYKNIDSGTAYHKGVVVTEFTDEEATHKLVVCLRFKNSQRVDDGTTSTCGVRECAISCAFGICKSQLCGFDVCKELTIKDSNTKECEMSDAIFNGNPSKECMSTIDDYLRLRAVKYNNHICTFLDVKGQTAYPGNINFFDGTETLSDGTCIAGSLSGGKCNGFNTESTPGEADKWRTILRIPYIQNNQPSGKLRGYLDKDGRLFPEQECIKTSSRIGPPEIYNLATADNSNRLFLPPLYLANARTKRGGEVSNPDSGSINSFGKTDFHYPALEARFGLTSQVLSLGVGYIGDEVSNPDSAGSATMTTTIGSVGASVEVFVQKEYDTDNSKPIFCLYRKIKNQSGVYLRPVRVGCVDRTLPEIDNANARITNPSLDPRKLTVSSVATNTFNNASISLQYLAGFGSNGVNNNCTSDDICTSSITLSNPTQSSPTCDSSIESYKICAQREECSKINDECAQNEIDMQNAIVLGESTASYLAIRQSCNETLLPICNAKKGITSSSIINLIGGISTTASDSKHYGWFNEICVSSGFETKLKTVITYKTDDGSKGKCLVNGNSPYLTDSDSTTNCDDGGEAPNCPCIEYVEGVSFDEDLYVSRTQTTHEAGLCIDIPTPKTCSAIDYNPNPNPDTSDLEYISSSLNKTFYNDSSGVHTSHQTRTNGSTHAEFSFAIAGMNDVAGECNGFWKNATDATSGASLTPKLTCLNVSGDAKWSSTIKNECVRYSCQSVTTTGPDVSGIYQGNYGLSETGENKGLSNGFATWPTHLQTSDFPESTTATACIAGFKKLGSTAITTNGTISGYSGGTSPTRLCNQLGSFQTPTNVCQRISCAAVNPATPTDSNDTSAWIAWAASGGATFPSVYASRSSSRIQSESISYGTCNNSLGFFQAAGAPQPSLECDYLGNWSAVKNPCVTTCNAVSDQTIAADSGNGYAYWNQVTGLAIGASQSVYSTQCVFGYVPYPYPPLKDASGTSFTLTSGTANYTSTIPQDVSKDNRAASYPQRTCQSATYGGNYTSVWTSPSSSCINQCPGSIVDARIGVGTTQHSGQNGTITVSWPSTAFGTTAYVYSPTNTNGQVHTAANYSYGRTNGYYILARYCNTNGKWSDPVPECATNGGEISDPSASTNDGKDSNATYTTSPANAEQVVAVGSNAPTGVCLSNYYKGNFNADSISSFTCAYKNSNNNIDEVYYQYVSGSACKKYCSSITANQAFSESNAYYAGTTDSGLQEVGTNLTLTCNSGYGSAIIYSSRTNGIDTATVTNDCGLKDKTYVVNNGTDGGCYATISNMNSNPSYYSSSHSYSNNDKVMTDRTSSAPSITCVDNTTSAASWSAVSNDCSACRNCPGFSVQGTYKVYGHIKGRDQHFTLFNGINNWDENGGGCSSSDSLLHDKTKTCQNSDRYSGQKTIQNTSVRCVDGAIIVIESESTRSSHSGDNSTSNNGNCPTTSNN